MPSSLIFLGLVVLWLLILVPTVARRQQEVARLSPALLSGRVLDRPMRHRYPEVGLMERSGPSTVGELVGARDDDVPGPGERAVDRYDEFDAEIDDDGRVHGLDDDPGDLDAWHDDPDPRSGSAGDRERDPRSGRPEPQERRPSSPSGNDRLGDDGPESTDLADEDLDDTGTGTDRDPVRDERRADGTGDTDPVSDVADEFDDDHDDDPDRRDDVDPDLRYDDELDDADLEFDDAVDLDDADDLDDPEYSPMRYRPGRGGFDPEAAAAAAHAKYAFRQRVVLALLVLLVAAVVSAFVVATVFWWVAGGLGLCLAGYLTYLRRQVRIEESIRARRAARLDGRRRPEDDDLPVAHDEPAPDEAPDAVDEDVDAPVAEAEDEDDWTADDGEPTRVRGTGEPLGVLPARRRTVDGEACTEHESSLPRLEVAPPPPLPDGTSLVDVDAEEEPDAFDDLTPHRRAVGE